MTQAKQHAVFISYRRDDAGGWPGRLQAHLVDRFGGNRVFRDIGIPAGVDYEEHVDGVLDGCSVLLAVIGPGWTTPRLNQPDDLLREEIERALRRPDVTVVPVLVDKAAMPTASELPESLKALARRQAIVLTDASWEHDVGILLERVGELLGEKRRRKGGGSPRGRNFRLVAIGTIVAVATGMFTLRDALLPGESGRAEASLVKYQSSVAASCRTLSDADSDAAAINKRLKKRLRSARTFRAQRAALLDAARSTNTRSARELAAFEELSTPQSLASRRRATVVAWTANQERLGTYQQRVDDAGSDERLAASVKYLASIRTKVARDRVDVRAGLVDLGGGRCALKPAVGLATITLPPLPTSGRKSSSAPAVKQPQSTRPAPPAARSAPRR